MENMFRIIISSGIIIVIGRLFYEYIIKYLEEE